ncbi:MAG: hypothetical protein A3K19_22945 [Lentisphaerae bacterium RIFOXYB12_FULL_65_16]|nr:MAG: hypothetical protein A3K18_16810 [Lentisphaerae bacterium RIFOXYA12_64_32]OGV90067.1 MAG: hypothetical protein A3K19_22945 [Lentisphaerae bacterium RIFOXYB12_FULL_65_16]
MLVVTPRSSAAEPAVAVVRDALTFDRHYLPNPEMLERIREVKNLSGRADPKGKERVLGWFEYDLEAPQAGWYELLVEPDAARVEVLLDGAYQGQCASSGPRAGSFRLDAGKHTLRIQKYLWWDGFSPVTRIVLRPPEPGLARALRLHAATPAASRCVFRKGETLELDAEYGPTIAATTLTVRVKDTASQALVSDFSVPLPATATPARQRVAIPCAQQGVLSIEFGENGTPFPPDCVPSRTITVVDTTPQPRPGGEVTRRLLREIDCTATEPDYVGGGATRVVRKSFGAYRESGATGWYGHMNSTEPSWFAYTVRVEELGRPCVIEVDYPDDALRTFCIAVRGAAPGAYPTAGGVDSGGEFSLTHRLHTHTLLHWPRGNDLRVLLLNATDGVRAAAACIRVYAIDGDLPPLDVPASGGRAFGNWYEEGSNFMAVYGGPDRQHASLADYLVTADRWARAVAYMGGDTLWPTLVVYQFGLYPSRYNVLFGGPFSNDLARIILYTCERYGMKAYFEFHPEARELAAPAEDPALGGDNFMTSKDGVVGNRHPNHFNPIHPRNQAWTLGMVGEFADQYRDCPAFRGVCLRQMEWANPALWNFHSLDWGYEDFTVGLFEKETGVTVPVAGDAPGRFGKRHAWLLANARDRWVTWRCDKIVDLFTRTAQRVRQARPDLQVLTNRFDVERGVDNARLAAIDGVSVVNGASYGRRADMRPVEARDQFLATMLDPVRDGHGNASYLIGSTYLEATEVVVPPVALGFPAGTQATWTSCVVNPAGRHCLERWAQALAGGDARFLSDGGNAYTLGQPLLREFLAEYRRLPDLPFQACPALNDPVALRQCTVASADAARLGPGWEPGLYLYAVNRERYPVKVELQLDGADRVQRLRNGEAVTLDGQTLRLELQPYELRAFRAAPGARVSGGTATAPAEVRERLATQVSWVERVVPEIERPEAKGRLKPEDVARLKQTASDARKALDAEQLWHARAALEWRSLELFRRCGSLPPFLRDDGPPALPAGALDAAQLVPLSQAPPSVVESATVVPDWTAGTIAVTDAPLWELKLDAPVAARYRLQVGHAAGGDFGPVEVRIGDTLLGRLEVWQPNPHGALSMLPILARWTRGPQTLAFRRTGGVRTGVSFVMATPVVDDILALRWQRLGPFSATSAKVEEEMARVYAPETARNLDGTMDAGNGVTLRWTALDGFGDFIDLSGGQPHKAGQVGYAVTHVFCPDSRRVRFSYGMDYWIKIWLNGTLIKDFEPHAGGAPFKGQFQLDAELRPGCNELLVKVGSGSHGNGFWLAVTNPGDLRFAARP